MERQEPKFGKSPDMSGIEFRNGTCRGAQYQASSTNDGLVWKVAIGVFIGMSLCLLATCTLLGIGASAVAEEQEKAQRTAVEKFIKDANDPDPFGWQKRAEQQRREEIRAKALKPGQRCIQGQRFQRVDNGWVQLSHEPC